MSSDSYRAMTSVSGMKQLLDELTLQFNTPAFITNDPVSIPHLFSSPSDIEVSAFLIATIAWGRRDLILRSGNRLMELMGNEPYNFIKYASDSDLNNLSGFVHRTFNGVDAITFIKALRNIYSNKSSMEPLVYEGIKNEGTIMGGIMSLRNHFFEIPHERRSQRHFSDVSKGSAGKKINMFLRWMVRDDNKGVDFGLWKTIDPSMLIIPLDIHAGNTARHLGLLTRRQNDWKAASELTERLRSFDKSDPVKYDFALFGAGVNGIISK